ncbi:hypothetical protein D5R40_29700 [Okeania hirsuta]|uniref:Uncharacterized protein n=1 Tax=Okeania hirsuta TaxID=1458930 RepID=A0A3N6PGD0_9CYAN|nr:hypothetical protein [Okeania hirsuta]RQH24931.1 hypothetical protein D5R40_29700 [Okeania hirsuta]
MDRIISIYYITGFYIKRGGAYPQFFGKEEGRRKKEEERGKREEGYPRKKKPSFPVDIHPWVYTNDWLRT